MPELLLPFPTYLCIQPKHRIGPILLKFVKKRGITYEQNGVCCLSAHHRGFESSGLIIVTTQ